MGIIPFDIEIPFFDPFRPLNDFLEALLKGLRQAGGAKEVQLSPADIAIERIKKMQWLLYQGYVKRRGMKRLYNERKRCERFISWSAKYSGRFRSLIDLYPEWLDQFADPRCNRAKLMRTIAFHLYQ